MKKNKNKQNKHVNEIVTESKQIREITMPAVPSLNLIEYVIIYAARKTLCSTHIKIRI